MSIKNLSIIAALSILAQNAHALSRPIPGGSGGTGNSSSSSSTSSSHSSSSSSSSSTSSSSSSSSSVSSSSSSSSSVSSSSSSSSSSTASSGKTFTAQIVTIAAASSCIKTDWANRGTAPKGYIKGMALAFARSLCRLNNPASSVRGPANVMAEPNTGNDVKDVISWYNSNYANIGVNNDNGGASTIRSVYALQIGLGMRESSGAYCVGHDTSAGSETSLSAETGTFQVSYDSFGASPQLAALYDEYQNNSSRCMLDIWTEGASCSSSDWANIGSGAGANFQKFTKNCPAFGAEYAAVLLRVLGGTKGEFGPIRTKAAQLTSSCENMLGQVQTLVENNETQACSDVNQDDI